ncbi:hypothetical protein BsIDN1_24880 [Bacillus safensis]|uniref:6-phosphogluconate dehydrogenase NADP-binding domain-containing protein n=1 Tax=Bacillus safensis TaxID=561879 RepID=A0A5S9M5K3_BACIA|nr:hypothetical protein BsIDN1_24880 [Bacillus safensis]
MQKEIELKAKERGVYALDAPVSGGDIGAQNGTLAIMIGGERSAYEACLPLFKQMGENIQYQGPAGSGQHTKKCVTKLPLQRGWSVSQRQWPMPKKIRA